MSSTIYRRTRIEYAIRLEAEYIIAFSIKPI